MEDYIFDGEPHALDKDTGYILKKINPCLERRDLNVECLKVYRQYVEYLLEHDKEKVIKYLMGIFEHCLTYDQDFPDTNLIIKDIIDATDATNTSISTCYKSVGLKFKRGHEDNLEGGEP